MITLWCCKNHQIKILFFQKNKKNGRWTPMERKRINKWTKNRFWYADYKWWWSSFFLWWFYSLLTICWFDSNFFFCFLWIRFIRLSGNHYHKQANKTKFCVCVCVFIHKSKPLCIYNLYDDDDMIMIVNGKQHLWIFCFAFFFPPTIKVWNQNQDCVEYGKKLKTEKKS